MNKKKILQLAMYSYTDGFLDEKKVTNISSLIRRSDLKKYINALKNIESLKKIIVSVPISNINEGLFRDLFPNKKIIIKKDPSLLLGVKVIDNDIVYEFSLKNSIENLVSDIKNKYD